MEPQLEAWKGPMSNCQAGKSLTCELPDGEAQSDDTEMAPAAMRCGTMDTEPGMVDCGTGHREWGIYFTFSVLHLLSWCDSRKYWN